ncbi:MAG: asparaginase [Betaproteobacteria bacterium]|nr:asparaginase [Betaproteobacteria bacterium]
MSKENLQKIVVLGMGGTIAGVASDPQKPKEYKAGALGVADLIGCLGMSQIVQIDVQNVAQINSKDMQVTHWQALLSAVQTANQDPQTRAVVITHGTDTLEETACLLEVMGPWSKPVVLTCAMLPANAPDADGPGNLKDALNWASYSNHSEVFVVCAGKVHLSQDVQKITTEDVDAFTSGPQACFASKKGEQWEIHRQVLDRMTLKQPSMAFAMEQAKWPRVEMVTNHALNDGALVRALLATSASEDTPLAGIVLAGTGMGTASQGLEQALQKAQDHGVRVWLSSRCVFGLAHAQTDSLWGVVTPLSAAKARTALCLELLAERENQL